MTKKVGELIKEKRVELNLSQDELATKLGYSSRSSINKIELGLQDVPKSKAEAFSRVLGIDIAILMGWDVRDTKPYDFERLPNYNSEFDKVTFEISEEIKTKNAFINYINSIGYEFIEPNQIKKGSVLVEIADNELLDLEEKSSNYTDELLMELIKKKIGL